MIVQTFSAFQSAIFHRLIGDDEMTAMRNSFCHVAKKKLLISLLTHFFNSSFLQIPSTMKEDEIDAGEPRGGERFVTHVDLNQAGTLLVSMARARSLAHIK